MSVLILKYFHPTSQKTDKLFETGAKKNREQHVLHLSERIEFGRTKNFIQVFDEKKTRIWPRAGFEQNKKILCMRQCFDL